MEDRRDLLRDTVGLLKITPGRRGGRGFDLSERLDGLEAFDPAL
jgi:hypothetical protein